MGIIQNNSGRNYGAIIETPAERGVYTMIWNVSSSQITHSFDATISVTE
jgi:hypothetical protein